MGIERLASVNLEINEGYVIEVPLGPWKIAYTELQSLIIDEMSALGLTDTIPPSKEQILVGVVLRRPEGIITVEVGVIVGASGRNPDGTLNTMVGGTVSPGEKEIYIATYDGRLFGLTAGTKISVEMGHMLILAQDNPLELHWRAGGTKGYTITIEGLEKDEDTTALTAHTKRMCALSPLFGNLVKAVGPGRPDDLEESRRIVAEAEKLRRSTKPLMTWARVAEQLNMTVQGLDYHRNKVAGLDTK